MPREHPLRPAHRLIMFYGVCPGAGKTTLSGWLRQRLVEDRFDAVWLEEHDVFHVEVFREVVRAFTEGAPDYVTPVLRAAQQLVALHTSDQSIVITDSLFPAITWLFAAGVNSQEIQSCARRMAAIFTPLNPLVIFLDGEVRELLKRAIHQRGDAWLQKLVNTVSAYNYVPIRPVVGMEELVAFYEEVRHIQLETFAAWKHSVLKLEVTTASLHELQRQIMGYLHRGG